MRILQVCPRYPPQTGGVETHVREISERLVDRGHEVTVHTADEGMDGARHERRVGVEVRRHRGLAPNEAYYLAPGIMPAVRRCDTDIVHAHNYHSFPIHFAAMGVADQRFVVTPHYHGGSSKEIRDHLLSLLHPVGRWMLRRASEVIAVSPWERDRLHEMFAVEPQVIPNGIEVERFEEATPERYDHPYLLTVGRLVKAKGVEYAIRALTRLPDHELLIAGSGPYRRELEQIAAEGGVAERVKFLGYVPDERLPGLYAGATVYVTLSTFEAYGLAVGEAIASGTPCVVLDEGGLTHWTDRDDCVAVTDRSPDVIAAAIEEAAGRVASPAGLFKWDEVTDRVEAVYDKVLEREGRD